MSNAVPDTTATPKVLPANPRAEYKACAAEIDAAIAGMLEHGRYILGPQVKAFEDEFAAFHGRRQCVGVNSGTDALHLALRALGIGAGDAVITVSHTAVATVAAIELAGAVPVLVDVQPDTFTMDPRKLADLLADWDMRTRHLGRLRPRAVLPVHLYGHMADMPRILEIAKAYELKVVEDCAQAHGARLEERLAGTWGDLAAFSFYPTKNLGAIGDAGALLANHDKRGDRARLIREYGWRNRYVSELAGMNTRLDEIQAAILRVKLPHLNTWNAARRQTAAYYSASLTQEKMAAVFTPPAVGQQTFHVFHQYVIKTSKGRDDLQKFLSDRQIMALIHYPTPVHLQPAYRDRGLTAGQTLPVTERLADEILSLPIHPYLKRTEAERVTEALREWSRKHV